MNNRTYPSAPIVGVGAAVYKKSEILLIKRGKPPLQNVWTLPGGRALANENLAEATIREIYEECNIKIKVKDLIDIFEYIEKDKSGKILFHYIVFDFLAIYESGMLKVGSDAHEAMWINIDRLKEYNVTEKAREMILKGLKMLNSY